MMIRDNDSVKRLYNLLETFISGEDRSLSMAGKIEVALDEMFPEDDEIQDYVTCFASYRPGGGEFLYDEDRMVKESKLLMDTLQSKYPR